MGLDCISQKIKFSAKNYFSQKMIFRKNDFFRPKINFSAKNDFSQKNVFFWTKLSFSVKTIGGKKIDRKKFWSKID